MVGPLAQSCVIMLYVSRFPRSSGEFRNNVFLPHLLRASEGVVAVPGRSFIGLPVQREMQNKKRVWDIVFFVRIL